MVLLGILLPYASGVLSLVFAILVLLRFVSHRGGFLLVWGIGLLMYSVGEICEGLFGSFGWNPLAFRLWYLFGGMLVAAWLGQGSIILLAKKPIGMISLAILTVASIYGAFRVFSADLDPIVASGSANELTVVAIRTPGVRSLTPFFNIYGTLALVGCALYSAIMFIRNREQPQHAVGNILIAGGAILPAIGGTLSRFGVSGLRTVSELFGAVLIFIGYLLAVPKGDNMTSKGSVPPPG